MSNKYYLYIFKNCVVIIQQSIPPISTVNSSYFTVNSSYLAITKAVFSRLHDLRHYYII